MARARAAGVPARQLGLTGGDALTLEGERPILVAKLRERFEGWLAGLYGRRAGLSAGELPWPWTRTRSSG